MELTPEQLKRLCCPVCHAELQFEPARKAIACLGCARRYPVVDGLPVLIAARSLT